MAGSQEDESNGWFISDKVCGLENTWSAWTLTLGIFSGAVYFVAQRWKYRTAAKSFGVVQIEFSLKVVTHLKNIAREM